MHGIMIIVQNGMFILTVGQYKAVLKKMGRIGRASRMKLNELLNAINLGNLSILLFLVLSLVEISPIKINSWSMLIRWLARLLGIGPPFVPYGVYMMRFYRVPLCTKQ